MNLFKRCSYCNREQPTTEYTRTRCKFFTDGYIPVCNSCLDLIVRSANDNERWNKVNKLCQWVDVPFIPKEWEKIYRANTKGWFSTYCRVFGAKEFDNLDWREYNDLFLKLHQADILVDEVPGYEEEKYKMLTKKWGPYEHSELDQLEDLFNETIATQNVTTGNQIDQLKKICKTSLLIDERIAANQPYKDLMDSYEKLIKTAELTPKNTKNSNDFDSIGEVGAYLESLGWLNKFYDGATRDEVDETIKNVQNWTRKLCIGESTMTEEIEQKINNLIGSTAVPDYDSFDYDEYEKGATDILKDQVIEVEV